MRRRVVEDWSHYNRAVEQVVAAHRFPRPPAPPPAIGLARRGGGGPVPVPPAPPASAAAPARRPLGPLLSGWFAALLLLGTIALLLALSLGADPRGLLRRDPLAGSAEDPNRYVSRHTVFHTTAFAAGSVTTGWEYASNRMTAPSSQFCYYGVRAAGGVEKILALPRGRPGPEAAAPPEAAEVGLGAEAWREAHNRCRWHPAAP